MRDIDPELQARLASGATTLCRCWLIVRKDGLALGFTDHDADLSFDGHVFKAGTGLDAASLEMSTGLSVDNSQAVGALSAAGISETDIQAGRFDGATVKQWLVDWQLPHLRVLLFAGFLGEIKRSGAAFDAELRGLSEMLNRPIGRSYLKGCDRVLGDAKCGVDATAPAFRTNAHVNDGLDFRRITLSEQPQYQSGWFMHGVCDWISGENAGHRSIIKSDASKGGLRFIELWTETPLPIAVGDTVRLTAGCDKQSETCRVKFQNLMNFRGFPDMPGEDWTTAYPVEGAVHNGGSRRNG